MTDIQTRLLEMLGWFDSFCRQNEIRYYILGGTLLGAMRHNGFIPWDDDIDIGLPRKDYEEFIKLFCDNSGKYVLETVDSPDIAYCYPYAKLYDSETTLIENTRRFLARGIYLDIFPIDGLGNTKEEAIKHFSKIQRKNNFYLMRICGTRKGRKWYKNWAVRFVGMLPDFLVNDIKKRKEINLICQKYDYDTSLYVANCVGNWGIKEILLKEYFGTPQQYTFETIKVMGPEKGDEYLTGIYGNWKKLPPKEKQVSHHDYKEMDLDLPYGRYET